MFVRLKPIKKFPITRLIGEAMRIATAGNGLPRSGRTAWTHNQALMELGALVYTARVRHCSRCPVAALCLTRARDPGGGA